MKLYSIIKDELETIIWSKDEEEAISLYVKFKKIKDNKQEVLLSEIDFDEYFSYLFSQYAENTTPIQAHIFTLGVIGEILTATSSIISTEE